MLQISPPAHLSQWLPVRQTASVPRTAPNNLIFGELGGLPVQSPAGAAAAGSWTKAPQLWPLHSSCDSLIRVDTSPAVTVSELCRVHLVSPGFPSGTEAGLGWEGLKRDQQHAGVCILGTSTCSSTNAAALGRADFSCRRWCGCRRQGRTHLWGGILPPWLRWNSLCVCAHPWLGG